MTPVGRTGRLAVWLLLLCCLFVTAAGAEDTGLRTFKLPDQSTLKMQVPSSWKDQVQPSPQGLPPTLVFGPASGQGFMVMVTPLWPKAKGAPPAATAAKIRQMTEEAAARVKPQAVEKTIRVRDLKSASGPGYFFAVTDRAPKPGEYKYMTQGMLRIGEVLTTFTIFTNDGREDVVPAGLAMLQSAVHEKAP